MRFGSLPPRPHGAPALRSCMFRAPLPPPRLCHPRMASWCRCLRRSRTQNRHYPFTTPSFCPCWSPLAHAHLLRLVLLLLLLLLLLLKRTPSHTKPNMNNFPVLLLIAMVGMASGLKCYRFQYFRGVGSPTKKCPPNSWTGADLQCYTEDLCVDAENYCQNTVGPANSYAAAGVATTGRCATMNCSSLIADHIRQSGNPNYYKGCYSCKEDLCNVGVPGVSVNSGSAAAPALPLLAAVAATALYSLM